MITKYELEKLKELAKAASPGVWDYDDGNCEVETLEERRHIALVCNDNDTQYVEHLRPVDWECDGYYIAAANPATVLRLIEALEVATEAIKEIEAKKDKTRLHECCVNNTCMEVYKGSHKVANCAFQYGVNQGYLDSADLAQEALNKIYGE